MALRLVTKTFLCSCFAVLGSSACGSSEKHGGDGGDAMGGVSGAASGGVGTGGSAVGGTESGGRGGGAVGGTATGGSAAGGAATGGSATGGSATGGAATGGSAAGGAGAGGSAAGGSAAGDSGSGGSQAGTSSNGGSGGQGAAGGRAGSSSMGGSGTAGSSAGGAGGCAGDGCAFAAGVSWQCRKRFMYGVNFAWQTFAGDFGGYANQRGVAANRGAIDTNLYAFKSNGADVIRWWVWPDFRGFGVTFSGTNPTGFGGTTLADLETALELANRNDVYLMLTLFSFDNFKTTAPNANMSLFATDAARRAALVTNVVRPFARAAQASQYSHRLIAWDVINEPEWAVTGASLYGGDQAFDPQDDVEPVTHAQMETLLRDIITGLRAESSALVTVGSAAMKWKNAWSRLDLDFYQFHIYDWVHTGGWPYNRTPTQYGVNGKPVVMGEFPPTGIAGASYRTVVDYWYGNGYAGALPWRDATYVIDYPSLKSFADAHACETQY